MPLTDLRIAAHLYKPFHRNKDFAGFISQYYPEEILGEGDRDHAKNGAHLLHKIREEFVGRDDVLDLESDLTQVLVRMEVEGVHVDEERLQKLGKEFEERIEQLRTEIFVDEQPFNLNSSKQLQVFLFEKKGIQPIRKTKTGWSTDEDTLTILAKDHPVCEQILQYRHLSKLLSTYINGLQKHIDPHTKRVHTTYDQIGAATGRMSSDSPNLQNIPAGDPDSDRIKACFCPVEPGLKYLVADYSQVELRILACLSGDSALLDTFRREEDVHMRTAKALFGEDVDITPNQRTHAKSVNFGVIYGITGFGLSKMMPITPAEGKDYIAAFYETYPVVRQYYDQLLEQARKDGYVQTFFGRKRYLPGLNDANAMMRQAAEREAINMPIQGTSADIIKYAMIGIDRRFQDEKLKSRMLMQVHDELVFEVPDDEVDLVSQIIRQEMEGVVDWDVHLKVDVGIGDDWSAAK